MLYGILHKHLNRKRRNDKIHFLQVINGFYIPIKPVVDNIHKIPDSLHLLCNADALGIGYRRKAFFQKICKLFHQPAGCLRIIVIAGLFDAGQRIQHEMRLDLFQVHLPFCLIHGLSYCGFLVEFYIDREASSGSGFRPMRMRGRSARS